MQLRSRVEPILLVDDNPDEFLLVRRYYSRSKLENPLEFLRSGREFLAYMDAVRAGERAMPALVLMDINMPGIDGFEAVEAIRSTLEFSEIPPIVMFTNSGRHEDRHRARVAGANDYFVKPIEGMHYQEFFDRFEHASH